MHRFGPYYTQEEYRLWQLNSLAVGVSSLNFLMVRSLTVTSSSKCICGSGDLCIGHSHAWMTAPNQYGIPASANRSSGELGDVYAGRRQQEYPSQQHPTATRRYEQFSRVLDGETLRISISSGGIQGVMPTVICNRITRVQVQAHV